MHEDNHINLEEYPVLPVDPIMRGDVEEEITPVKKKEDVLPPVAISDDEDDDVAYINRCLFKGRLSSNQQHKTSTNDKDYEYVDGYV